MIVVLMIVMTTRVEGGVNNDGHLNRDIMKGTALIYIESELTHIPNRVYRCIDTRVDRLYIYVQRLHIKSCSCKIILMSDNRSGK